MRYLPPLLFISITASAQVTLVERAPIWEPASGDWDWQAHDDSYSAYATNEATMAFSNSGLTAQYSWMLGAGDDTDSGYIITEPEQFNTSVVPLAFYSGLTWNGAYSYGDASFIAGFTNTKFQLIFNATAGQDLAGLIPSTSDLVKGGYQFAVNDLESANVIAYATVGDTSGTVIDSSGYAEAYRIEIRNSTDSIFIEPAIGFNNDGTQVIGRLVWSDYGVFEIWDAGTWTNFVRCNVIINGKGSSFIKDTFLQTTTGTNFSTTTPLQMRGNTYLAPMFQVDVLLFMSTMGYPYPNYTISSASFSYNVELANGGNKFTVSAPETKWYATQVTGASRPTLTASSDLFHSADLVAGTSYTINNTTFTTKLQSYLTTGNDEYMKGFWLQSVHVGSGSEVHLRSVEGTITPTLYLNLTQAPYSNIDTLSDSGREIAVDKNTDTLIRLPYYLKVNASATAAIDSNIRVQMSYIGEASATVSHSTTTGVDSAGLPVILVEFESPSTAGDIIVSLSATDLSGTTQDSWELNLLSGGSGSGGLTRSDVEEIVSDGTAAVIAAVDTNETKIDTLTTNVANVDTDIATLQALLNGKPTDQAQWIRGGLGITSAAANSAVAFTGYAPTAWNPTRTGAAVYLANTNPSAFNQPTHTLNMHGLSDSGISFGTQEVGGSQKLNLRIIMEATRTTGNYNVKAYHFVGGVTYEHEIGSIIHQATSTLALSDSDIAQIIEGASMAGRFVDAFSWKLLSEISPTNTQQKGSASNFAASSGLQIVSVARYVNQSGVYQNVWQLHPYNVGSSLPADAINIATAGIDGLPIDSLLDLVTAVPALAGKIEQASPAWFN